MMGLMLAFFGRIVEVNGAIHDPVIGDRNTVHAQLSRTFDDAVEGGIAVEETVFGVYVQMNKIIHNRPFSYNECDTRG